MTLLLLTVALLDWLFRYGQLGLLGSSAVVAAGVLALCQRRMWRLDGFCEAAFIVTMLLAAGTAIFLGAPDRAWLALLTAIAVTVSAAPWGGRSDRTQTEQAQTEQAQTEQAQIQQTQTQKIQTQQAPWLVRAGATGFILIAYLILLIYRDELRYFFSGTPAGLPHPEFFGGLITIVIWITIFLARYKIFDFYLVVGALALLCFTGVAWPFATHLYQVADVQLALPPISETIALLLWGAPGSSVFVPQGALSEYLTSGQLPLPGVIGAVTHYGVLGTAALIGIIYRRLPGRTLKTVALLTVGLVPGGCSLPSLCAVLFLARRPTPDADAPQWWLPVTIAGTAAATAAAVLALRIRPLDNTSASWKLPLHCSATILAAEDLLFLDHHGVDWARLKQVTLQTVRQRRFERGGSTLSMQLAKVKWLSYERTVWRKAQQLLLGRYLELRYSKREIFTSYLSSVPFGPHSVGIERAAKDHFGIPVEQLTARQCRLLALLIPDPNAFNPLQLPLPKSVGTRERELQIRAARFSSYLSRRIRAKLAV